MHTINSSVIEFRVPDTRCIEKQVLDVDNSGGLSSIEFRLSIRDLVRCVPVSCILSVDDTPDRVNSGLHAANPHIRGGL